MDQTTMMLFTIGFVLLSTGVRSQRPEIVNEILPEVKPVGGIGRLNCTVVNLSLRMQVVWNFPSRHMVISENKDIQVLNKKIDGRWKYEVIRTENLLRTTFKLVISHLTEEDSGTYNCYVKMETVDYEYWPIKKGQLTVQVPPTIRPGSTSTVVEVEKGEDVNLTCSATGIPSPNITWTRADGGTLPTGGALSRGHILHLPNINENDRGIYRCVADNNVAPPAEHKAQVLVFFKPSARPVETSVGQAENKLFDATVACIVSGHPKPDLQWSMKTNQGIQTINDDEKHLIHKKISEMLKDGEWWYSLTILNVQANDYTDYICTASNIYGQSQAEIELFSTIECQGALCPSLGTLNMATCTRPLTWTMLLTVIGLLRLIMLWR
ncbi:hypothetical protein ScPMuIL_002871 [Solemya velum]